MEMRPFSKIESGFGSKTIADEIYDLRANLAPSEVPSKVFNGFTKACHTLYKFDSDTERIFAIVLENDDAVLRWMRPSSKQFNIWYGAASSKRYEPDFVVETEGAIYMVETKAERNVGDKDVREKAKAATAYCDAASNWNASHGGKPWHYELVAHTAVKINSSFLGMLPVDLEYNSTLV